MKIAANAPDELILEERPFWLAGFLGLFFIVMIYAIIVDWSGLEWPERALYVVLIVALGAAFVIFVKWVRVSFLRSLNRVVIVRRGLPGEQRETYPLKSLTAARVHENRIPWPSGAKRVVLEFDNNILNTLDVETRAMVERRRALTSQSHDTVDAPLTAYYAGLTNADVIAETINAWREA